jgi:exosome complex RNA-binding protein Rrp4
MKKYLVLCFLISVSFTVFANEVKKSVEDSAFIYIYRAGQFSGSLSNWAIFVDDKKICKLSNGKFIKVYVTPGKHKVSAKIGGVDLFKKETDVEIEVEAGGTYYVACNIKQSITRARLEMIEVAKSTGQKQMEKMTVDKCQEAE